MGCVFVLPGRNHPHIYYLTQSKSSPKKRTNLEKRIIEIPKSNHHLQVDHVSTDPLSQDFTAFTISNSKTREILGTFRADDIVQQRNFMAALGGKGAGLFTQNAEETHFTDHGVSSPTSSEGSFSQLTAWHQRFDGHPTSATDKKQILSYEYTMRTMSSEYYLPEHMRVNNSQTPLPILSDPLPIYDISNPPETRRSALLRRNMNDTFRPPHGSPVCSIVSLGYGKEVDLEPHQQAVWCMDSDVCYCLDHITKSTFSNRPRLSPALNTVTVTKREISFQNASTQSLDLTRDSISVKSAGERALRKPHGLVVNASGEHGQSGTSGKKGNSGLKGDGDDYREHENDGRSGSHGALGTDGQPGTDGGSGKCLTVSLKGDATQLNLNIPGCYSGIANLGGDACEEVVLLNCHGGDGGDGGAGGDGGEGGDGEDGKRGSRRKDGGHGGDGGNGGAGGRGGRGGKGGSGGECVIQATDPRLLVLIEADCRAGRKGTGGQGGKSGEGGRRGFGGEESVWEELDPARSEVVTVAGLPGKPGMAGSSGVNGEHGSSGPSGRDGAILWVVKNTRGETVYSSNTRYEAEVTSLQVSSTNDYDDDDTFEPNQKLNITNVTIVNRGGLPLPAGAVLSFPSTDTVLFEATTFALPEIAVNETFVVPTTFCGRIVDHASPNSPGPLNTEARFSSKIDLLGRPFEKSQFEKKLKVTYPLKMSFALSRKTVSRGETTSLEIGIENTSGHSYGCSGDTRGSAWVQVHLDSRLIPLGVIASAGNASMDTHVQSQDDIGASLPYQVTFDPKTPDSMYIMIKTINPGETIVVPIAIQIEAYAELYDLCVWQADLWLRGKLIEYKSQEICVSPAYSPPSSPSQLGDVLMITNDKITQDELKFWKRIFELLGVSVDYWDASHKTGESTDSTDGSQTTSSTIVDDNPEQQNPPSLPHVHGGHQQDQRQQHWRFPPINQMYSGKMILFPHCSLQDVPMDVILSHFHGQDHQREQRTDLNSSMLLFLDPTFPESLEFYTYQGKGHVRLLKHLCSSEQYISLPKGAYTGHHLIAPGTLTPSDRSSKHAEKATMKRLEKDVPSQAVALSNSTSNIQHSGLFKYSYGAMHVRRCPLLRSCNFQCVDGAHGNLTTMGTDDPLLTVSSQTVPLGSRFGQVFLAVMCGLPLHSKLSLLKTTENTSSSDYVEFSLPNGVVLTKGDLAAICIAHEVADEVYNYTGEVHRMTYVAADLDLSKALLRDRKRKLVSKMLDLIKREVAERKKSLNIPPVVQMSNKILDLCNALAEISDPMHTLPTAQRINCSNNVAKDTAPAAVSTKLPPLRLLQDSSRVMRSHQHFVDQDRYNISDLL